MLKRSLRPRRFRTGGRRLFLFLAAILSACSSSPRRPTVPNAAIIFIPGFYGSALADSRTGSRVFLTGTEAIFGSTPLGLPVAGVFMEGLRPFKVDGILEGVNFLGGLFSVNAYGKALDRLNDRGGAEVVPFAYDWRQTLADSAEKLSELVASMRSAGRTRIAIVAHSMGGLVASYYLRYGDQPFDSPVENWVGAEQVSAVVIMGTPFRGSNIAFRNLHTGTSLGRSDRPLSAESLGTFPSMYQLLPPSPSSAYVDTAGREVSDWLSVDLWRSSRFGWFRPNVADAEKKARELHVKSCLLEARNFRKAQMASPRKKAPRLAVLSFIGTGQSTLARAVLEGTEAHGRWWFSQEGLKKWVPTSSVELEADGDGTVTTLSARLPPAFAAIPGTEQRSVKVEHTDMPGSDEVFSQVSEFLTAKGF